MRRPVDLDSFRPVLVSLSRGRTRIKNGMRGIAMTLPLQEFSLDRMVRAVEKVKDRLRRSTAALEAASIPYAVIGGNAVAAWVSRVDESAARATQDVDILIRREDLDRAKAALESVGFVYRHAAALDMFLDGPSAKARDAVHVIFAGEKVRPTDLHANPEVVPWEDAEGYRIIPLEALVRVKLNVFRRKDQVHLQDMIGVGLIDESWPDRLPPELGDRLRALLDDPEG